MLLRHAFPIDHQTDGLMLTLSELGLLRLYLLPQSVVSQCMDGVNREGSWHTHSTRATPVCVTVGNNHGDNPSSRTTCQAYNSTILVAVVSFCCLLAVLTLVRRPTQ